MPSSFLPLLHFWLLVRILILSAPRCQSICQSTNSQVDLNLSGNPIAEMDFLAGHNLRAINASGVLFVCLEHMCYVIQ